MKINIDIFCRKNYGTVTKTSTCYFDPQREKVEQVHIQTFFRPLPNIQQTFGSSRKQESQPFIEQTHLRRTSHFGSV